MDPNANIDEQRALATQILHLCDLNEARDDEIAALAHRLAELVQALDEWRLRADSIRTVLANAATRNR